MNKKVYLIRHGKIDVGNEKKYIGITDYPLSNEGIRQVEHLKKYFSQIAIEKVYTSPLKRCLQTTEIMLENKRNEYIVVEDFKEINMGIWENKPMAYMKKNFPELYENRGNNFATFTPPEGESFNQLASRVLPTFDNIVKRQLGAIIIVAHAGVNRVILSNILGLPLNNIFNIQQPYACVNELTLKDENLWEYKLVGADIR